MSILSEERGSDSPYVETIIRGRTVRDGAVIRPAENRWHLVLLRHEGTTQLLVVGPLTTTSAVSWTAGAELLWIRFKLGTFMPQRPTSDFLNRETPLPGAAQHSFWLHGAAWQFPDYDNADTFVNRLVRDEALVRDPVVNAVLQDQPHDLAPRTVRQRFVQATGLTRSHIRQVERAQRAAALLRRGVPIADTVYELGYFDQPHLTRALKHWIGHTPAQLIHQIASCSTMTPDSGDPATESSSSRNARA